MPHELSVLGQAQPYKLNDELFVIDDDGAFIVYLPLRQTALRIDETGLAVLKRLAQTIASLTDADIAADGFLSEMREAGVITNVQDPKPTRRRTIGTAYAPTSITLSLTNDCNLGCTYCYASAGTFKDVMSARTAMSAIDFVRANATSANAGDVVINFHGGGEPFSQFKLMKEIVDYARQSCGQVGISVSVLVTTNGVLSAAMREWAKANVTRISLSVDGPPKIQDRQRPTKTGGSSSAFVEETIRFLDAENIQYGVRSTITALSMNQMAAVIDYFVSVSSSKRLHFEPVFESGRCASSGEAAPAHAEFAALFKQARLYARSKGVTLTIAGTNLQTKSCTFCGAGGDNFLVTPTGEVSTCVEVTKKTDRHSDIFLIGELAEDGALHIDSQKLDYLRARTVDNIPDCQDCFAKYSCSGDCMVKVASETGSIFKTRGYNRCEINRSVLLEQIKEALAAPTV